MTSTRRAVSVASQIDSAWPGMSVLRLLRIFKVFRIFARLGSLRMLAESLLESLLPVVNALSILLLVSSVYAILGVQLFQDDIPESFNSFSSAFITVAAGRGKESGRVGGGRPYHGDPQVDSEARCASRRAGTGRVRVGWQGRMTDRADPPPHWDPSLPAADVNGAGRLLRRGGRGQMFAVSTLDGLSELGDAMAVSCGAGGVLFLVSYVVVGADPPPHPHRDHAPGCTHAGGPCGVCCSLVGHSFLCSF